MSVGQHGRCFINFYDRPEMDLHMEIHYESIKFESHKA